MILNILNWYQTVGKDLSIKDKTKENTMTKNFHTLLVYGNFSWCKHFILHTKLS